MTNTTLLRVDVRNGIVRLNTLIAKSMDDESMLNHYGGEFSNILWELQRIHCGERYIGDDISDDEELYEEWIAYVEAIPTTYPMEQCVLDWHLLLLERLNLQELQTIADMLG